MKAEKTKKTQAAKTSEYRMKKSTASIDAPAPSAGPLDNTILSPGVDGKHNAGTKRTVTVLVFALTSAHQAVRAGCFPLGAALDSGAANVKLLTPQPARGFYRGEPVATVLGVGETGANNSTVAAWAYSDVAGTADEVAIDPKEFRAYVPESETVDVDARWCPWFAWAANVAGQNGLPESGSEFKPNPIVIPTDATRVTVSTDDSLWMSGPNLATSLGRADDQVGLENPLYKNAALNSAQISLASDVNRYCLVGMLGGTTFDNMRNYMVHFLGDDQDAGTALPFLDITNGADQSLFLSFHEGADWTNNSGSIRATLTWTV